MKTTVALADWDADITGLAEKIGRSPFSRVVLCVEDRHVLYRDQNVIEAVQVLQDNGLEVELDPWGIQGFSGESVSHPMAFYSWLRLAERTNASALMLEEPIRQDKLTMDEILTGAAHYAPSKPLHLAVAEDSLSPELHKSMSEVSLTGYLNADKMRIDSPVSLEARVNDIYEEYHDCFDSVWVPLCAVPNGKEWIPGHLIKVWHQLGVPVNVWAWDGLRTVSSARADDFDLVWRHTLHSLEEIHQS